ncbi:hypothetical protein GCM10010969_34100 [Saccharibacillus kuerlensis]|uniref:TcaA protein NTF2-like domain-containing protein n=2 Tax=Saccharibacillus kuerlensis TaxID=459527 RepID=A0ABQ2L880_9BACL|nr:hypothetical protein GCM10010969_34100 [Saccharibacillus kuerlensis]
MSKKNKILAGTIGGAAVLLAAAFLILRVTYGPSTPEELAEKLNAAIDAQDPAALVSYLDDSASPLLAEDRIQAFKASLQDDYARSTYKQGILNAIQLAESTEEETERSDSFSDKLRQELDGPNADLPASWMTFVKEQSWRGSKWSLHIVPVAVEARLSDSSEDLKTTMQIGELSAESGAIQNLWPSTYTYTGALTGDFGSQSYDGQIEALQYPEANTVTFDTSQMNQIALRLPSTEASVTLNDKEITGDLDAYVLFRPVPEQIKLTAKKKAYGLNLSDEQTLNTNEVEEYQVEELLQQAAAEHVVDLAYTTMESWAKGTNAGSRKLFTGYDPSGDFGDYLAQAMEDDPSSRYALNKVVMNPYSIHFYEDHLTAEFIYYYARSDDPDDERSQALKLEISRQKDKDAWWITGYETTYVYESEYAIQKENPKFEQERSELAKASEAEAEAAEAEAAMQQSSGTQQASASGSYIFTEEDAQSFMSNYLYASISAINARDFSYVESYMDPAGPAYKETSDYIPYLETKGITEAYEDAVVTDFQYNGDSTYTVKTRESVIIYNKDNEGTLRHFNSEYKLSVIDGSLKAYKLISTKEIE